MIDLLIVTLIPILIHTESRGVDRAIGDLLKKQKAYGCLQIREPVCRDYNQAHGTKIRARDCRGNRKLSEEICTWYLKRYATEKRLGRKPTLEDMARIWNGGPDGWKERSTRGYWEKVKKNLKKRERR